MSFWTIFYFVMTAQVCGLLVGLTLALKSTFKLYALIFLGAMIWPVLAAGFFYLKWCDRKGARP